VIAFSKGNRGWAAFNNGTADKTIRVQTGLPKGTYCDTVHGTKAAGACSGPTVTVNTTGFATVTLGDKDAVAFTRADRL
jgi:alpha-amylase